MYFVRVEDIYQLSSLDVWPMDPEEGFVHDMALIRDVLHSLIRIRQFMSSLHWLKLQTPFPE